jgi:hypothetical protein
MVVVRVDHMHQEYEVGYNEGTGAAKRVSALKWIVEYRFNEVQKRGEGES